MEGATTIILMLSSEAAIGSFLLIFMCQVRTGKKEKHPLGRYNLSFLELVWVLITQRNYSVWSAFIFEEKRIVILKEIEFLKNFVLKKGDQQI